MCFAVDGGYHSISAHVQHGEDGAACVHHPRLHHGHPVPLSPSPHQQGSAAAGRQRVGGLSSVNLSVCLCLCMSVFLMI